MSDKKNSDNKASLFAKIPKAVRLKKSVLVGIVLLGVLFVFVILSHVRTQDMGARTNDTLESEADNTHWLAQTSASKPETDIKNREKENNDQSLTIAASQEEQLAKALKEIDGANQKVNGQTDPIETNNTLKNANNSPIQVSGGMTKNDKLDAESNSQIQISNYLSNTLATGNLIPIIFLTEVNSELPGYALVQVTRSVSNAQGKEMIPQGTKILLQYESANSDLERLAYKGISMTLPCGKTISLNNVPVVDSLGRVGLKDKSNHHYVRNTLATVANFSSNQADQIAASQISNAINKGEPSFNTVLPLTSNNSFSQKATTFYIRPGYECNLLLTHDLVF